MDKKDYSQNCDFDDDSGKNDCLHRIHFLFPIGCMYGEDGDVKMPRNRRDKPLYSMKEICDMYKNKYFKKIGYNKPFSADVLCKYRKDKTDKRYKLFKKQRAKYGRWDETCTWALNTFIAESLYTWLNLYVESATNPTHTFYVDLDFYDFEIEFDGINTIRTEREWIMEALSLIKEYLLTVDSFDPPAEEFGCKCMEKALIIIGKIFPALWW